MSTLIKCARRAAPLLAALLFALSGVAAAAGKTIQWKPSDQPLLRVDDRPLVEWNVYQEGKKLNPLLVEMNGRYVVIDQQLETVFEVPNEKIAKKGNDLYWDPADHADKPLETSGWIVKDVGSAYRVHMKLVAEDHVLDLQIPHPLDIRPITPRYY